MGEIGSIQVGTFSHIWVDDSNTNAAVLAEYFEANKCMTKVRVVNKSKRGEQGLSKSF
jgi:hypothetical protein